MTLDSSAPRGTYPFLTLPDYLSHGLKLVFVGINPSLFSVERGHYFARSTNRFWPAFSRSCLSAPVRAGLGREILRPEDDAALPGFGIGFTDVVKVPSSNAAVIRDEDYREWVPRLLESLQHYQPAVACFQGVTGYRAFARHAFGEPKPSGQLGAQERRLGATRLYVVPNPSPANAHFKLADQIEWYDRLAGFLDEHG
jgi:double-stranded uracil-DNA glycosylase